MSLAIIFSLLLGGVSGDWLATRAVTKDVRDDFCARLYVQHADYAQCVRVGGTYINEKVPNR